MKITYLDNAATSWPKPPGVLRAMSAYLIRGGGNPGRSGHRKSIGAARVVLETRERLADLFNIRDPANLFFTKNATEALNIAIHGTLRPGDHAVATGMEHNSVMRPLARLGGMGIEMSVADGQRSGEVPPEAVFRAVRPNTRLVAVTHASNVTGAINDIGTIGRFCSDRGIAFLVDAAQTAGVVPIDVERERVDLLAFSGHKGLLGPQGTGALYARDGAALEPLMQGGTGSLSDLEEQPGFLPDKFECGTLNTVGIAGLGAGVAFIRRFGMNRVLEHDGLLLELLLAQLGGDERFTIFGPSEAARQTGVVSLNIGGRTPSSVGELLDRDYGIQARVGLHCAPRAHKTIGTFPDGTVRLSWGVFTSERDILHACRALKRIAGSGGAGGRR
jgi:cysteine desulfurase family protein